MTAIARLPHPSSLPPSRRRLLAVVVAVVVVLVAAVPLGLKALSGASSSSGASSGVSSGYASDAREGLVAPSTPGGLSKDGGVPAESGGGAKAPAADVASGVGSTAAVIGAKIARTAWVGIKVTDLPGAAARARVIATGAGGQVTSENVVTAADPTGGPSAVDPRFDASTLPRVGVDEARLVLSVPAEALDTVLTELSKIGTVSYRSSQSQDVTDTYVDTKARIQPMRDGIDRVRALLAKTTDLTQVITLESELSRRQADLDSLTQRLAQLDRMTTTSDVTVSLWTDATTPVEPDDQGLTSGLRTAWESLVGSLVVIITGLAALLPWLVLLAPFVWLGLRRWNRRTAPAPAAAAPAAGTAGPAGGSSAASEPQPVGAAAVATPTSGAPSTDPDGPDSSS